MMTAWWQKAFAVCMIAFLVPLSASADERFFTYSYEADVLPKGQLEFEQWLTARAGREGGDFTAWDFREELEYGLTEKVTAALYLNFRSIYSSPEETGGEAAGEEVLAERNEMEFRGISSEWKWQVLNPHLDPVGLLLYGEGTISGEFAELEERIVLSKNWENWVAAFNAKLEQEWEFEHGDTEREAELEFTAGIAYRFTPEWSAGLEGRNHRAYPGAFDLNGEEYSAWFVGPNVHYGAPNWWATLTVMPQVHGNGEGESGGLQLAEHERVEVRLIVGVLF